MKIEVVIFFCGFCVTVSDNSERIQAPLNVLDIILTMVTVPIVVTAKGM
jgi:hypothetical protein